MRSVMVRGEISDTEVTNLLVAAGAESQGAASYTMGTVRVRILVGKKFYFRTNDYIGAVVVTTTDGVTQRIDLSYAGAGSGFLGSQMGAGSDLENAMYDALIGAVRSRSLLYEDAGTPPG